MPPRPTPSFVDLLVRLGGAWMVTSLIFLAAVALLDDHLLVGVTEQPSIFASPWLYQSSWSGYVASLPMALAGLALLVASTRKFLPAGPGGTRVPLPRLVAILGVTGALGTIPGAGLELIAWLLAAYLLRRAPYRVPQPIATGHRRVLIGAGVAGLSLLVVPAAYGTLHPLTFEATSVSCLDGCGPEGPGRTDVLWVHNAGPSELDVLGVQAHGAPAGVTAVLPPRTSIDERRRETRPPFRLTGKDDGVPTIAVVIRARDGWCASAARRPEPRRVAFTIRYRVHGRTGAQRFTAPRTFEHYACQDERR